MEKLTNKLYILNITTTKKLNINSSKEILLRYIPQDKLGIKQMYIKSEFNFSSTPPNFVCLFKILDNYLYRLINPKINSTDPRK